MCVKKFCFDFQNRLMENAFLSEKSTNYDYLVIYPTFIINNSWLFIFLLYVFIMQSTKKCLEVI